MRNYSKLIGALAAVSALAAGNASAIDLNYNLNAGYTTEYLFRGLNLGTDLIEAGFDATAELGSGLTLNGGVWFANFQADDAAAVFGATDRRSVNEIDIYANVSKDLGFATATVGYIYYLNDGDDILVGDYGRNLDDAQEAVFRLSRDLGFAEAGLTYYWDVKGDNDGYLAADLKKSFELNSCLTLNIGSVLGYYVEHGKLAHLTTKVSLDYEFAENAKLSPFVAGSLSLSDDGFDAAGNARTLNTGAKNQFVGGIAINVAF